MIKARAEKGRPGASEHAATVPAATAEMRTPPNRYRTVPHQAKRSPMGTTVVHRAICLPGGRRGDPDESGKTLCGAGAIANDLWAGGGGDGDEWSLL